MYDKILYFLYGKKMYLLAWGQVTVFSWIYVTANVYTRAYYNLCSYTTSKVVFYVLLYQYPSTDLRFAIPPKQIKCLNNFPCNFR